MPQSLKKTAWCRHREVFLASPHLLHCSTVVAQSWEEPQDTHSPQTALQQLQPTDHHPSPTTSGSGGRESFLQRVAEQGRQQSRRQEPPGTPQQGFYQGALAVPGHRGGNSWRLDYIFGCSFVLTSEKQVTEPLSWDACPSCWFSPTFPG